MAKPRIIWINFFFFSFTFVMAAVAAPFYGWFVGYSLGQVVAAVLLLGYAGMSITMGYHRLWSHRTFDAHPAVRAILALGGALAIQNSILHWASDHREHHRHVDHNDKDPYSARRGFWHSHIGWMLREYQEERYRDYSNVKDLKRDPIVAWQHKHYWALAKTDLQELSRHYKELKSKWHEQRRPWKRELSLVRAGSTKQTGPATP